MRAEEFDTATIKELQDRANKCFELAQSPLEEPRPALLGLTGTYQAPLDDAGKLRLLLEAQFYLAAVARKRDERVARRDFWMEVAVIALIGFEIILSLIGLHDGNQQASILVHMDKSAGDTALAMKATKESLETLVGDQEISADRLKEMNDKLQGSLSITGNMASSTHKQLQILQAQQKAALEQQSKKPKMRLYFGANQLLTDVPINLALREETDTTAVYDLLLWNEGNAIANRAQVRINLTSDDIRPMTEGTAVIQELRPIPDAPKVYVLNLAYLRPGENVPLKITFSFPKGHPPFNVVFSIDADEIATATPLGAMTVTPRKP